MTEKTKSPFSYFKGEVFGSDDGLDVWNSYPESELSQPDEVEISVDPLSSEISILAEEMEPQSGQRPPTSGAPIVQDEDIENYRKSLANVYTSNREKEVEANKWLQLRALYSSLQKNWDTDAKIEYIVKSTNSLMAMYPEDGRFLEKCGELLCSFDPSLPNTHYVKVVRKAFSESELADLVKVGKISEEDMQNALQFEQIKKEAQEAIDAQTPATLDHEISLRSTARFPELKEEAMSQCEECAEETPGIMTCRRCSTKKNRNHEVEQN